MKKTIYLLILLLSHQTISCQKKLISGKIIDNITQKGIYNVHVYSAKLGEGTITNADGNFYLIVTNNDNLHFSCVGFEKQSIQLSDNDTGNLVIKMNQKIESLDEIVVSTKTLTANEILNKVFDNFEKNHYVEPVYYNFYNRVINYKKDSTLQSIEEYAGTIKQNRAHFTKYNIEKGRIKYVTKDSVQQLKKHRVVAMDKMYTDNIYKYREDYLKKKGLKKYTYKVIGRTNFLDRNCYEISFYTDKSTYYKKGILYIDMQDFAIIRKILLDNDNEILNDITFKKENDKWYLKKAEDFHTGYYTPNLTEKRITLYNFKTIENNNLNFIKLTSGDFSTQFTSDFNDKYWENKNFIPLPNWIKEQLY
ncbi:carboxypeptidase-like regulatory domain-containing protein [Polaribacter sp. MED152]|uniref:carboxypeptidase-like regulatory domain-containing protein n=1 Tax=Polaribacter sp. MED152 TaxID=313598 RepID=UPI000068CCA2|nr:carboxypeptidase-like regulatory domain-containing protein [Polaribacter sp. MED152]EAQ43083.1 hypothetical protein MED152_10175 [Polaribacter sp. MED152]